MKRRKPDEDDGPMQEVICANCNGSGEGMYDGSTCSSCGGSGTEWIAADDEPEGEEE